MYYLGKKKGKNVKFDVKFRNFESMTKKSSEILADEKTFFGTWKSVTYEILLSV